MSKSSSQKLKIPYLMKLFIEKTDEKHSVVMTDIISYLEQNGIKSERKSIYDDIEVLKLYGMDIQCVKGKTCSYQLVSRQFELPELKLLVDLVQTSRFITHKKSMELIKKIESLASTYEASWLQRDVYVAGRIKTENESIYYNVDRIQDAKKSNVCIHFKYYEWTVEKKMQFRKAGQNYIISPWALTLSGENYYMVGFDHETQIMKHYRVDKMKDIEVTDLTRQGKEHYKSLDTASYTKKIFGMYGGKEEVVKLRFDNKLAGVVIDQFGKDISLIRVGKDHFTVNVTVAISPMFLGWLFGLGSGVQILSPANVVKQMKEMLGTVMEGYCDSGSLEKSKG